MASLSWDGTRARIQFFDRAGKRHALRLGEVSRTTAETVRGHIGTLEDARRFGITPDRAALAWLDRLDDDFHAKLSAHALCEARVRFGRVCDYIDEFIAAKRDAAPGTLWQFNALAIRLRAHFPTATMDRVSVDDAFAFRDSMPDLARATIGRHIKRCREVWRAAGITPTPFDQVPIYSDVNRERMRFIDRKTVALIMDAGTPFLRAVVALSRYGGLRCPSEVGGLRWADIDWTRKRFTVRTGKTGHREVPLFPELAEALDGVPRDGEWVVFRRRKVVPGNYRNALIHTLGRIGVTPWPRLFHNMRSSREIELNQVWPLTTVSQWLGHSPTVSARHYLAAIESDFIKAAQEKTQTTPADAANPRPR